jgi:hypothetical protein
MIREHGLGGKADLRCIPRNSASADAEPTSDFGPGFSGCQRVLNPLLDVPHRTQVRIGLGWICLLLRGVESNHGFQDQNLAGFLATPPRIKVNDI